MAYRGSHITGKSGWIWHGVVALVYLLGTVARAEMGKGPAVLRVGTSGDYAPFSFRTADGSFTGFDIAVARRLAADLGRPVEFVPFRWAELMQRLQTGAFDLAMSGVTVRPDRAVQALFTRPYAVTGAVAVVRARDRARFAHWRDCDRVGVRLGVNAGGHLETVARERCPRAQVVPVSDNRQLPELLLSGQVDVVISEEFEARSWAEKQFRVLGPFTRDRKAYAVAFAAGDLAPQVDRWLAEREADGWLNQQRRQWLGQGAAVSAQQAACDALVAAMDLRLQLMPAVAAVKRRDGLPITDPAQEARVLEHVRTAAAAVRLDPKGVADLFRVQIEAAKDVESAGDLQAPSDLSLTQLRTAVSAATDCIIAELARSQPWLHKAGAPEQLAKTVRTGLTAPGLTRRRLDQMRAAVLQVRRLAPAAAEPQ